MVKLLIYSGKIKMYIFLFIIILILIICNIIIISISISSNEYIGEYIGGSSSTDLTLKMKNKVDNLITYTNKLKQNPNETDLNNYISNIKKMQKTTNKILNKL